MLIAATLNTAPQADAKIHSCRDYVDLARQVGWPRTERANIKRIMYRESRCFAGAWNSRDPWGGSHGLLQINGSNIQWAIRNGWITNRQDLNNPRKNLKVGLELWKLYGWRPWGTKSSTSN